ncbi:MAG: hypothetical protein FWB83_05030 [Treponema sp.]|nr:hypothetical protein [Treponema sp.]
MKIGVITFISAVFLINMSYAQTANEFIHRNSITVDFGPTITSAFIAGISAQYEEAAFFGLGVNYERFFSTYYSVGGDIRFSYMNFPVSDAVFFSFHAVLYGRYYFLSGSEKLFININLGGMQHNSPFQYSFMFSIGSAIGWRFLIQNHFIIELSMGWTVFTGDKYLAPWSMMSLSEILIPGLYFSIPIGLAF